MDGYELKIKLLRQLDRADDVVPQLEAAAAADRHNLALKMLLARECRQAGKASRAEAIYKDLAAENPTVEVYHGIFDVCKSEGPQGIARVLDLLNETLGKVQTNVVVPEAGQARAMLGALRDDRELIDKLLPVIRQRLQPSSPERSLSYQTNLLFAMLAVRANQAAAAEELYRGLLKHRDLPGNLENEVYSGLLEVLALRRKHAAVIEVCRQGLEKAEATSRLRFYLDLTRAYAGLGQDDKAVAAADEAVNMAKDDQRLRCRLSRARTLAQCDDPARKDRAVAECRALLKDYNEPGDVRLIRYTLSGVYSTLGDEARSEEQLKLILDADPNDASACNDLGYLWADQNKNLPEAERLIRKALELDRRQRTEGPDARPDADRDNGAYVDSLGWVLFRRGQLAEARHELERVPGLPDGSDDPVVWDHLGDVCFRQGDKKAAGSAWRKSLELYRGRHPPRPRETARGREREAAAPRTVGAQK